MLRALVISLLAAASSAAVAVAAESPSPPPPPMKVTLVRGTVESTSAASITLKLQSGADITAAVTPKTRYATVAKRTLAEIKPTDFVGITAVPGRNGHLRAEEVHIIPVVGVGEGQYPWDHHPSGAHATASSMSSMTNGTVVAPAAAMAMGSMTNGTVMAGSGAGQLSVTYRGSEMVDGKCEGRADPKKPVCTGTAIVDVPADTPIAAIVDAKAADVQPGLAMVAFVLQDDKGQNILGSITVEKNGVKPEF